MSEQFILTSCDSDDITMDYSHGIFTDYSKAYTYGKEYKQHVGDSERVFLYTQDVDPVFDESTSLEELPCNTVEIT
jgi:hypothetical protein